MIPVNGKILVSVDKTQKNLFRLGNIVLSAAIIWEHNHREKSPVLAKVINANRFLKKDDIVLCHHNMFGDMSPYYLHDDLYSIPCNITTVFMKVSADGILTPVFGNMICKRIPIPSDFPVPPEYQKFYINQYEVLNPGWTKFKQGQIIYTRPNSGYEMVYNINGDINRVIRVNSEMVCAAYKKKTVVLMAK